MKKVFKNLSTYDNQSIVK